MHLVSCFNLLSIRFSVILKLHFLVISFQYGKVLAGTVGNTRLILREGIKHKPTVLDIIHFELEGPQPKAITERIFYRTDSN